MASAGRWQLPVGAERNDDQLLDVRIGRVHGVLGRDDVVDEPGIEGVGLEQLPALGVVDADGVVVAAGDPQAVVGVLVVDADGRPAHDAFNER